jgi:hypothetical protein
MGNPPHNPTWFADQQSAAEAHTSLVVTRMETALPGGGTRADISADNRPEWLTALFIRHNDASANGQACDHVADGIPGIRFIVAWHPGVIVCAECMRRGLLMPPPGSDAEFTCDGCGIVHREGVRMTVLTVATDTLFHLGVCTDCLPDLQAAMD